MAGWGNPFSREHSTSDSFDSNFPKRPIPEGKFKPELDVTEYIYPISNEVVDHLRRIIRSYANKMGGFPNILALPRRQVRKKERPYLEDSLLVGYFEELVYLTLQETVQPLNQLGPKCPSCSPFQTLVQSPSQSPSWIMVGNAPLNPNANQPNLIAPASRARTPPVHALPHNYENSFPIFDTQGKAYMWTTIYRFFSSLWK